MRYVPNLPWASRSISSGLSPSSRSWLSPPRLLSPKGFVYLSVKSNIICEITTRESSPGCKILFLGSEEGRLKVEKDIRHKKARSINNLKRVHQSLPRPPLPDFGCPRAIRFHHRHHTIRSCTCLLVHGDCSCFWPL